MILYNEFEHLYGVLEWVPENFKGQLHFVLFFSHLTYSPGHLSLLYDFDYHVYMNIPQLYIPSLDDYNLLYSLR